MRAAGATFLTIPDNYYPDLDSRYELARELLAAMKQIYDRDDDSEFFQVYTHAFEERFFFEIVERRGYKGFGAPNAGIRLAAQTREARPRTHAADGIRTFRADRRRRRPPQFHSFYFRAEAGGAIRRRPPRCGT